MRKMTQAFFLRNIARGLVSGLIVIQAATAYTQSKSTIVPLKPSVEELVDFETESNAVAVRSSAMVEILNYEIPLKELISDIALDRVPKEALASLIFKKNGVDHVRWVINPEDTKWHKDVEKWLKSKNLSVEKHKYFQGYKTASRSYIVTDPNTNYAFSVKVSTDKTGGNWTDKKQPWDDARQVKLAADHAQNAMKLRTPENFLFMDEPIVFGIKDIDQGMIMRSLQGLQASSKRYFIPGFSALHEAEGAHIAKLNGSDNPAEFWKEHYIKPLGRAIAELFAMTGFAYDSPHSQNFMVELDGNFKPTGKIVFRDLGDSYLTTDIAEAMGRKDLVKQWESGNNLIGRAMIAQGVLHGNHKPSWVTEAVYNEYGAAFFVELEKELSRLTKIPITDLFADGKFSRSGDYFSKNYRLSKPSWKAYLADIKKTGGLLGDGGSSKASSSAQVVSARKTKSAVKSCRAVFTGVAI